jgi:hypothetical protein
MIFKIYAVLVSPLTIGTTFLCPGLLLVVSNTPKKCNRTTILLPDFYRIIGNRLPCVRFRCNCGEYVARINRRYMLDRTMDRNGMLATRITRKGESAVGQSKGYAAMCHAKTIQHFGTHVHAQRAAAFFNRHQLHTHPTAEWIVVKHTMKNGYWIQHVSDVLRGVLNH